MNKLIIAIIAALAVVGAVHYINSEQAAPVRFMQLNNIDSAWTHWKQANGKTYGTSTEESYRKSVFVGSYNYVSSTNESQTSYKLAVNKFADMTKDEFRAQYLGLKQKLSATKKNEVAAPVASSDSVDWRGSKVTGVKDQGQCGSCWAFSTTGGLEGFYAGANGTLESFSEQQLMDCSGSYGNQSCNGGLMDDAYDYVKDRGLGLESAYPYTARDGSCRSTSTVVRINSYADVPASDAGLANAVAITPVSVAIDANPIQFYSSGIYNNWNCGNSLDHGVLAVGYGSENGQDYWIVKNSWGASFGESGYFRLARRSYGVGMCGITMQASYPTA